MSFYKEKFTKFRESQNLVIFIVFVAMMMQTLIDAILVSILPNILWTYAIASGEAFTLDGGGISHNSSRLAMYTNLTNYRLKNPSRMSQNIGLVVSARAAVQIATNAIAVVIVDRFGHFFPMIFGSILNTFATLGFALAPNIAVLVIMRVIEAGGSSLSVVACMALLTKTFQNEQLRNKAIGQVYMGYAVGLVVGYPLGPITYEFCGLMAPFSILAGIITCDGVLRLLIRTPKESRSPFPIGKYSSSFNFGFVRDPYVVMSFICTFSIYNGVGIFLATGFEWMMSDLNSLPWQISVVMFIALPFMIVGQIIANYFLNRDRCWYLLWVAMLLYVTGTVSYPFVTEIWLVIGSECLCRFAIGLAVCCISSLIGYLAHLRHSSAYGTAFALSSTVNDVGFVVGPVVGGYLVNIIGFKWLYFGNGCFVFLVSFFCFAFRRIPEIQVHSIRISDENLHNKSYETFDLPFN